MYPGSLTSGTTDALKDEGATIRLQSTYQRSRLGEGDLCRMKLVLANLASRCLKRQRQWRHTSRRCVLAIAVDSGPAAGRRLARPGWREYDIETGARAARDSGLNILAQVRKAVAASTRWSG